MQSVSKSMVGIVSGLDRALASNNLEKMAMTMDQFERQLEDLDLQSEFVEGAMSNQATLSTPEDEVNSLLQQVRNWHLDFVLDFLQCPCLGTPRNVSSIYKRNLGAHFDSEV